MTLDTYTEFWKAQIEYYKHLTALSTGSILLIATFLEKLFATPHFKWLVIISLFGFLVCLVFSIIAYTVIVDYKFPGALPSKINLVPLGKVITVCVWSGFLVGVVSLGVFTIINLFISN